VIVGLPDTIWLPQDALIQRPADTLSFLLFPVQPEHFDAAVADRAGAVREIQVEQPNSTSSWIWGALKMPGRMLMEPHARWRARLCADEYSGTGSRPTWQRAAGHRAQAWARPMSMSGRWADTGGHDNADRPRGCRRRAAAGSGHAGRAGACRPVAGRVSAAGRG